MSKVMLNLGCGSEILQGWINVDKLGLPGVDRVCNLDIHAEVYMLSNLNTVDGIRMFHVLEHLDDPLRTLSILYDLAKPNARLKIACPYGFTRSAWGDLTHKRAVFEESFVAMGQPYYHRNLYQYHADWKVEEITYVVPEYARVFNTDTLKDKVRNEFDFVKEIRAVLRAVKPARPRKQMQSVVSYKFMVGSDSNGV